MFNLDDAVSVEGWDGIAFSVLELKDHRATVIMIGDDRKWEVDINDLKLLKSEQYCRDCGQIGCYHNNY